MDIWENRADKMISGNDASTFLRLMQDQERKKNTRNIVHVRLSDLFLTATKEKIKANPTVVALLEKFEKAEYDIRVLLLGRTLGKNELARNWLKEKNWPIRENHSGLFAELERENKCALAIVDLTKINHKGTKTCLEESHYKIISPRNIKAEP